MINGPDALRQVGAAMICSRGTALIVVLAFIGSCAGYSAAAQSCQGIRVEIGAGEQRCIQPGAGEPFKDCPGCPEMVAVPAASFTMGPVRTRRWRPSVRTRFVVSIARPFAVGKFAVTRGEFAAFVAATGRRMEGGCHRLGEHGRNRERDWRSPGFAQDDRHPVVCVSWHDAKAYAAWLSSQHGQTLPAAV